jgi:hypothetical protein
MNRCYFSKQPPKSLQQCPDYQVFLTSLYVCWLNVIIVISQMVAFYIATYEENIVIFPRICDHKLRFVSRLQLATHS